MAIIEDKKYTRGFGDIEDKKYTRGSGDLHFHLTQGGLLQFDFHFRRRVSSERHCFDLQPDFLEPWRRAPEFIEHITAHALTR